MPRAMLGLASKPMHPVHSWLDAYAQFQAAHEPTGHTVVVFCHLWEIAYDQFAWLPSVKQIEQVSGRL